MSSNIRRLNDKGIDVFEAAIKDERAGRPSIDFVQLSNHDDYTESISSTISLDPLRAFSTRYEFGVYLASKLDLPTITPFMHDRGFWTWLALLYYAQLKQPGKKPSKPYNYIQSNDYRHRPRHAVFMTWSLVSNYGDKSSYLLSKSMHVRGELIEQLMAQKQLLTFKGIMELSSELYTDEAGESFKKGSTSRTKKGAIIRFINWVDQISINYDVYQMTKAELSELLPSEFDEFRSKKGSFLGRLMGR